MSVNPADVQGSLSGINYPCTKGQVMSFAKDNGATQDVLDALQKMPGASYHSAKDISRAIGQIE